MGKQSLEICILILSLLAGCGCGHEELSQADCTEPARCLVCGKAEGIPKGHQWLEADCTNAQTCAVCGQTKGEPRGHSWKDATNSTPQSCRRCGATRGEPLKEEVSFEDVYDAVCDEIGVQLGKAEFTYNAEACILYVSIPADKGTAEEIILTPDSVADYWAQISEKLCSTSKTAHERFLYAGFTVDCCIFLISDVNEENALLAAENGKIYFDVME